MVKMKKVGIVGGIGPTSTLNYYTGVISGVRAKTSSENYPEIIINSIDMTKMLAIVANNDWEGLTGVLLDAIQNLASAGADFAAIASNTPHIVFAQVQRQSALPLISIVDATCKCAQTQRVNRAVVIGTKFTMSSGLYSEALEKYNISAVVPSESDQTAIHNIIFPKLEDGIVIPEDKLKMLGIVNSLMSKENADALLLGCTELPLMIKDDDIDKIVLNTTQIHIDAIVDSICRPA